MAIRYVSITCPACGAIVKVDGKQEQFFCTYCGTQIEKSREGETVIRKIDEAMIFEAELKLRLRKLEIEREAKKRQRIDAEYRKNKILLLVLIIISFEIFAAFITFTGMIDEQYKRIFGFISVIGIVALLWSVARVLSLIQMQSQSLREEAEKEVEYRTIRDIIEKRHRVTNINTGTQNITISKDIKKESRQ